MNGVDPLLLQKLLGHQTLEMTKKYVNLFGNDLKKGFNKYSPLEQGCAVRANLISIDEYFSR